jgi:hypothetical protein
MMNHLRKQGYPALRLVVLGAATMASSSCGEDLVSQPRPGTILVAATTVGDGADPSGYTVSVDGGPVGPIGTADTGDTIYVEDVEVGSYQVRLAGMEANCSTLPAENPVTVTVVSADTVNAEFEVTCDAAPPPPGGGDPTP